MWSSSWQTSSRSWRTVLQSPTSTPLANGSRRTWRRCRAGSHPPSSARRVQVFEPQTVATTQCLWRMQPTASGVHQAGSRAQRDWVPCRPSSARVVPRGRRWPWGARRNAKPAGLEASAAALDRRIASCVRLGRSWAKGAPRDATGALPRWSPCRKAAWSRLSAFVQKITCAPAYSEVPRMERAADVTAIPMCTIRPPAPSAFRAHLQTSCSVGWAQMKSTCLARVPWRMRR
mmetsp:Transcript_65318/g.155965  ORF Transcript_65318/g.155965 Transcript_65318/m.155965 type:complete len:232 (+) Transcript_65318:1156-1851(+)